MGVVLVFMVVRLFFLQLYPHEIEIFSHSLTGNGLSRKYFVRLESDRGKILDRRGRTLSGERWPHVLVFPQSSAHLEHYAKQLDQLAAWTGISPTDLRRRLSTLSRPALLKTHDGVTTWKVPPLLRSKITQLGIPGVRVLWFEDRPSTPNQTLLGHIQRWNKGGENHAGGESGLERSFDSLLRGRYERWLEYTSDVRGRPLNGTTRVREKVSYGPGYHVLTTLDGSIQRMAEQTLLTLQVEDGALVVQDIETGDLLAVASRAPYEKPGHRSLMATPLGSLYHTILTLSALQGGWLVPDTLVECSTEVPQKKGGLWDGDRTTFADAYLRSCESTFSNLAIRMGEEQLVNDSYQLGLGQTLLSYGITGAGYTVPCQVGEEEAGVVSVKLGNERESPPLLSNSPGQSILVTPLQAVQLVTALHHRGVPPRPRLVQAIWDQQGGIVTSIPQKKMASKKLSARTVQTVQSLMRNAVVRGREAPWLISSPWPLAGRMGTAIADQYSRYHQWMIGFGPLSKPRYAVAILVRYTYSAHDPRAVLLFRSIMNQLSVMGDQFPPSG